MEQKQPGNSSSGGNSSSSRQETKVSIFGPGYPDISEWGLDPTFWVSYKQSPTSLEFKGSLVFQKAYDMVDSSPD